VAQWNVVVAVYDRAFREAKTLLSNFGTVRGSDYRNVLVMNVENVETFLDEVQSTLVRDASLANAVSRIIPVTDYFCFSNPEEFESKARAVVAKWVPELIGKRFYVRMQRRGFKGKLSSHDEEQVLGRFLLERTAIAGGEATVDFDDPDIVIVVETLGQQAGLSRWTREQLERYELLRLD
jgi:tRNA(Ser,Leu) C12 N-acetylase TAN1